jgi:hypothetical protein
MGGRWTLWFNYPGMHFEIAEKTSTLSLPALSLLEGSKGA